MSFKYINPGYAELLTEKPCETVINETYNPQNKVCFSPYKYSDYKNYILLPYKPSEIYGLFYVTFTDRNYYISNSFGIMFLRDYSSQRSGLQFYNDSSYNNYLNVRMLYNDSASINAQISNYAQSTPYKIWFHIRMKTTENDEPGLIEFSINGGETFITQEFDSVATFYNRRLFLALRESGYFSNIIISDEYIDPKEEIIALPISSTETDMTFDSETGIYTATALNQTLLSAVDVEGLSNEYGSDSTVTGIALIGNPAYKTANGLTSLTAISKDSVNSVTEFDSISLSDDTSAMILNSFSTDTSIGNLQNYKFGWKAGS